MRRPRTTPARPGAARPRQGPVALGALLSSTRLTAAKRARLGIDPALWRQVVGRKIDEHTQVGQLQRGVLEVRVASPVWAQELSFHAAMIVKRLTEAGVRVQSLRFRVAGPLEQTSPRKPARQLRPPVPLPPDIAERLSEVDDEELRTAIAEAVSHWLAFEGTTSLPPIAPTPRPAEPRSDPQAESRAPRRAAPPRKSGAK